MRVQNFNEGMNVIFKCDILTQKKLHGGCDIKNNFHWVRGILQLSRPTLDTTQSPVKWAPGLFPGVKRPGRSVYHLPPYSAEGKERVELGLHGLFQGELQLKA
jgi:hypothetical protein